MRVKEGSDDYRYFPEPDIVPMIISDEWMEAVSYTHLSWCIHSSDTSECSKEETPCS